VSLLLLLRGLLGGGPPAAATGRRVVALARSLRWEIAPRPLHVEALPRSLRWEVTRGMANEPVVRPERRNHYAGETLPYDFDLAALLRPGESIGAVTRTLTKLSDGTSYAAGLSGAATPSGTVVTQAVTALVAGQSYRLKLLVTVGAKVWGPSVILDCPF
jgi:hypothetical protein